MSRRTINIGCGVAAGMFLALTAGVFWVHLTFSPILWVDMTLFGRCEWLEQNAVLSPWEMAPDVASESSETHASTRYTREGMFERPLFVLRFSQETTSLEADDYNPRVRSSGMDVKTGMVALYSGISVCLELLLCYAIWVWLTHKTRIAREDSSSTN